MILPAQALTTGAAPAAFDATAERLRRLLLRTSIQDARIQDLADAAELALEIGLRDGASALYGLMFLKTGFGQAGRALRSAVDARTGLWRLPPAHAAPAPKGFSVDNAIAELKPLIVLAGGSAPAWPDISSILDDTRVMKPPIPADEQLRTLETARRVVAILRDAPRLQLDGRLAEALRLEAQAVLSSLEPQIESNVHQSLETLIALFLLAQLRQFIIIHWDLLFASSFQLFDHAGLFDLAALGPYFSNVPLILREMGDLFSLIEVASENSLTAEQVETWAVLLSSAFGAAELMALIDEFANRGMSGAMRAVLARLALSRQMDRALEVGWRLRDAAIDIDALDIAVDAQRLVVHWRPAASAEQLALAELFHSQNATHLAEEAYRRAWALDGSYSFIAERLNELKKGVPRPATKGRSRRS